MKFDRAFLITLKSSTKRSMRFNSMAAKAGLSYETFYGIDGSAVNYEKLKEEGYLAEDFELRMAGSLGCLLSHVKVWEEIYNDENCDIGLIFEDDALLPKDFMKKFNNIDWSELPDDWDMLWLGWHKLDCEPIGKFFGKPRLNCTSGTNSGHFAYLVKSSSVPKIKNILIPYNNKSSKDVILRKNFDKFNAYFLLDKIVKHPRVVRDSVRKDLNDPTRNIFTRTMRELRRIGKKIFTK